MEEYYLMWLTRIDGIGLKRAHRLLDAFRQRASRFGVRNPLQFGGLQFWERS